MQNTMGRLIEWTMARKLAMDLQTEPGIANEKKEEISKGSRGMPTPPSPLPRKILKVETKICAIWGILETNLKKCSTLKFMTNISFVPSICIHRSIILIFIEKKYACIVFHRQYIFPWFSIFISARILVSAMNATLWQRITVLLPNQGGYRAGKLTTLNSQFPIHTWCLQGFQTKEQTLAVAVNLQRCVQQSGIQAASGTPWTIWWRSGIYARWPPAAPLKERLPCNLETGSPWSTADKGTYTRLSPVPRPPQCP